MANAEKGGGESDARVNTIYVKQPERISEGVLRRLLYCECTSRKMPTGTKRQRYCSWLLTHGVIMFGNRYAEFQLLLNATRLSASVGSLQ